MSCLPEEGACISREAEFVGSFEIVGETWEECIQLLRRRLQQISLQPTIQRKRVLLEISLNGINVCFDSFGEQVYMSHALKRISYATCHPELCQFTFLSRNPKGPANIQFCHVFLTRSSQEAVELNAVVREIFNAAYLSQCNRSTGSVQASTVADSVTAVPQTILSPQRSRQPVMGTGGITTVHVIRPDSVALSLSSGSGADDSELVVQTFPTQDGFGLGSVSSITESVDSWSYVVPTAAIVGGGDKSTTTRPRVDTVASTAQDGRALNGCSPESDPPVSPPDAKIKQNYKPQNHQQPSATALTTSVNNNICHVLDLLPTTVGSFEPTQTSTTKPSICRSLFDLVSGRNPAGTNTNVPLNGRKSRSRSRPRPTSSQCTEAQTVQSARRNIEASSDRLGRHGSTAAADTTPVRFEALKLKEDKPVVTDKELYSAAWYKPTLSREGTLDLLMHQEIGSFVVRDSTTHCGCYALSVKVPKYENPSGVSHYLISRTEHNTYRLKGLRKEWSCVSSLVTHHTVMRELLPCLLRLPTRHSDVSVDTSSLGDDQRHFDKENSSVLE